MMDDLNRYGSNNDIIEHGAHKKGIAFGMAYFHQNGRLWEISQVAKAVNLCVKLR